MEVYSLCNKQFAGQLQKKWRRFVSGSSVAPEEANPDDVASRAKTEPPMLARDISSDSEPSSHVNANTVV